MKGTAPGRCWALLAGRGVPFPARQAARTFAGRPRTGCGIALTLALVPLSLLLGPARPPLFGRLVRQPAKVSPSCSGSCSAPPVLVPVRFRDPVPRPSMFPQCPILGALPNACIWASGA